MFDQALLVTERGSGTSQIVIVENKGPTAKLVSRRGLDGRRQERGTQGYFDSTIGAMMNSKRFKCRECSGHYTLGVEKGASIVLASASKTGEG